MIQSRTCQGTQKFETFSATLLLNFGVQRPDLFLVALYLLPVLSPSALRQHRFVFLELVVLFSQLDHPGFQIV